MSTYEGKRTIDGLVVTVDGGRLDERYDVKRFTKFGFEWTYEGVSQRGDDTAVSLIQCDREPL